MTPTLRPYQSALIADVRHAWSQGARNVMAVLPCGGGKTVIAGELLEKHEGASVLIAHRTELLSSASLTLARYGVRHDIVGSSDMKRSIAALHIADLGKCYFTPGARCVVASVDTLIRRTDLANWAKTVTLWVVDESHHLVTGGNDGNGGIKMGNKWHKAVSMFTHPQVHGLGPTATPMRADGKGLGIHHDGLMHTMVLGPTMRELISDGYLTDYKVYCPESDLRAIGNVGASGDWSPEQLKEATRRSHVTGDVVQSYRNWAWGKTNLVFTTDVEAAHQMAANYNAAGVPAAAVVGTTDPHIRRQTFKRFTQRDILTIVTVDIVGEGTDIPACEVITEARLTQSLPVSMQHWGRGNRPMWADGREPATREERLWSIAHSNKPYAIYIDHTGSFVNPALGPPDREREWTLDRRDRKSRGQSDAIPLRVCLGCYQPFLRNLTACPHCGVPVPPPTARSTPEHVEGDLAELSPEVLARLRGAVAAVDRSIEDERTRLAATGLPDMLVRANVSRHHERHVAQGAMRDAAARWGGIWRARGENDREIQKRWYWTFGTDTETAKALGARDAEALRLRIDDAVKRA